MENKLSLLMDYQKYENDPDLQAVIDAVHARYTARKLSDEEADYIAAAGLPEMALKRDQPWKNKK